MIADVEILVIADRQITVHGNEEISILVMEWPRKF